MDSFCNFGENLFCPKLSPPFMKLEQFTWLPVILLNPYLLQLTLFHPAVHFYNPVKTREKKDFLMFSVDIEMDLKWIKRIRVSLSWKQNDISLSHSIVSNFLRGNWRPTKFCLKRKMLSSKKNVEGSEYLIVLFFKATLPIFINTAFSQYADR